MRERADACPKRLGVLVVLAPKERRLACTAGATYTGQGKNGLGVVRGVAVKKQEILDILDNLSDPIDPEELIGELYLKAKLERAEAAVSKGNVVSHEEVVQRSREWFK